MHWSLVLLVPDVVFSVSQMRGPVSRFPEAVALHLFAAVTKRCVAVWRPLQI